jgi:RES domain-containing protein
LNSENLPEVTGWRIVRPVHAANPLSGIGAARWGSRWNSVGVRMAYVSTSRALAILEMLVHVTADSVPAEFVLVPVEIPDSLIQPLEKLPEGWNTLPYGREARRTGDQWIREGSSLALYVPSVVVPAERNILINPAHAQFSQIQAGEPEANAFDRRLFRKD